MTRRGAGLVCAASRRAAPICWLAATPPATTSVGSAGDGALEAAQGGGRADGDDLGGGGLEAGGDVGDVLIGKRRDLLGGEAHGGLEAGEGEVEAVLGEQRAGEAEALGIAA